MRQRARKVLASNSRNCAISAASVTCSGTAGLILTVDMVFTLCCRSSFEDASLATAIDATGQALGRIDPRLASLRDRSCWLGYNWGSDAINACPVDTFRRERQPKPLENDGDKEAADRVLLPSGRFHDRPDGRAFRMLEQGEDGCLLGPGAPQGGAHPLALCSPFRLRSRRDVS